MRVLNIFGVFLLLGSVQAESAVSCLEGRVNVMECSHDEVVAYMELPDPERRALQNYEAWEESYKSLEVKKSESDPTVCVGLLYGDLQVMGDRIKDATSELMSLSLPSMSSVMSGLGDKLLESVCSRVEAVEDQFQTQALAELKSVQQARYQDINTKYGKIPMEGYISDAIIPPKFSEMGLKYRNGEIDKNQFRANVKNRWRSELDELKDSATGG